MEAKKQITRIETAKAEIALARAAARAASQRVDQRRFELGQAETAIHSIGAETSESDAGALVSRSQSLAVLLGSDSREAARLATEVERAVERYKGVLSEAEAYRQMTADFCYKLEVATGRLNVLRADAENAERTVRNLTANLAAARQRLADIEGN